MPQSQLPKTVRLVEERIRLPLDVVTQFGRQKDHFRRRKRSGAQPALCSQLALDPAVESRGKLGPIAVWYKSFRQATETVFLVGTRR